MNKFTPFIIAFLFCLFSPALHAQPYSADNPYQPSTGQIEMLKEVIPNFPEAPPMGELTSRFQEKFIVSNHRPGMFKYYLYVPSNYDARKKYPAVLMLHGGARHMYGARDYLKENIYQKHPAIIIVPIAPPSYDWNSAAPLALEALQDAAKHYNMKPDQIYVTGYSMGGIGAYSMLSRYKGIFAGALSVCGMWDPNLATGLDDIPLRIVHAEHDEAFPINMVKELNTNLKRAGRESGLLVLGGAKHIDCIRTYESMAYWDWLFSQRK